MKKSKNKMRELHEIFHSGELNAQSKFNKNRNWNEQSIASLNQMFKEAIDDDLAYVIEGQKYFFIATSNSEGECDCSFRGTESDDSGDLLQTRILVISAPRIIHEAIFIFS